MNFNFLGQNFSTEVLFERARVPVTNQVEKEFVELVKELDQIIRPLASEEGITTPAICSHRQNSGLWKGNDPVLKVLCEFCRVADWKPKFFAGTEYYSITLSNGF